MATPNHVLRDFPPRKYDILLPPTGWHLFPFHHPQRGYAWTEYADVTAKISQMDSLPNYPSYGVPLTRALSRARGAPLSYKWYKFSIFQFRLSLVIIHVCPGEDLQTFYLSEARGRTFHDLNSPSLVRLMKSSTSGLGLNHCEIASSPLQRWALFLKSMLNLIQPPHLSNLEPHHPIHLLICVFSLDLIRWL